MIIAIGRTGCGGAGESRQRAIDVSSGEPPHIHDGDSVSGDLPKKGEGAAVVQSMGVACTAVTPGSLANRAPSASDGWSRVVSVHRA